MGNLSSHHSSRRRVGEKIAGSAKHAGDEIGGERGPRDEGLELLDHLIGDSSGAGGDRGS